MFDFIQVPINIINSLVFDTASTLPAPFFSKDIIC